MKEKLTNRRFLRWLWQYSACHQGLEAVEKSKQSPQTLWNKCVHPCWMEWVLYSTGKTNSMHSGSGNQSHNEKDCAKRINKSLCDEIRAKFPFPEEEILEDR